MIDLAQILAPKRTPLRVWTARGVAMLADAIQIVAFPFFIEGGVSPVNDALDVIVAFVIIALLGWNIVFLPTIVSEVIPFMDLIPSWTAAVLFVTRKGATTPPAGDANQPIAKPVVSKVVQ